MKYRRILAAIAALGVLVMPSLAAAQNSGASAGQGLEISPPLVDLKANPGETKTVDIFVRNVTSQSLIVKGQVTDFIAAGEDGQPKLLLDETEQSPYSIKDWITDLPTTTIAPSERKSLTVTISLPANASPGGHYGVVRFTGTPPELEDTGVSLSASVGTLILINVSGDVKEEARIAEISTSQNNQKHNLFEYGPITTTIRFENQGTIHLKPSGTVRIINMFGKEAASFRFNENGGNVLPKSIRKFEHTLNKKLLFGRYQIQADVVYGSESKIITGTHTFWVIPYKLIILAIATLALLIFIVRRYNRLIVKRAASKGTQKSSHGRKKKQS